MTAITTPADYSQHYIGDTGNSLVVQFLHSDTISPYPLDGVNKSLMTFRMVNKLSGVARSGAGTWVTSDDPNGIASYAWNAVDVAQPGIWLCQTTVPFSVGPITFRPLEIEFIARL